MNGGGHSFFMSPSNARAGLALADLTAELVLTEFHRDLAADTRRLAARERVGAGTDARSWQERSRIHTA